MNRIDLPALTLAGPIRHSPVLDPLAVHHLENGLYIWLSLKSVPLSHFDDFKIIGAEAGKALKIMKFMIGP